MTESNYYVNEMFVFTKNGIKAGIFGSILTMVMLWLIRFPMNAMKSNVLEELDPSKIELIKTVNAVYGSAVLDPTQIICLSLTIGFVATLILSKSEIEMRMNYLKKKYNAETWSVLIDQFRSKGMSYPWWNNEQFWIESESWAQQQLVEEAIKDASH